MYDDDDVRIGRLESYIRVEGMSVKEDPIS